MRDPRRLLGRLGLILAGLAAGVLLAEVLARVVQPVGAAHLLFDSPDARPAGLYIADPELVQSPKPGFEGDARVLGRTVHVRINELGLRGPPLRTPAGQPRWLTLGDSFTLAIQVEEDQTFQALLAQQLGGEVLNAGVDGDGTWQSLGRFRRLAEATEPDGVVLMFFLGNDLHDNAEFHQRQAMTRGMPPGTPMPTPQVAAWERWLLGRSYVFAHWRTWNRARAIAAGGDRDAMRWREELSIYTTTGTDRLDHLSQNTEHALAELRRAVEGAGSQLMVALAPAAFQVEPDRAVDTLARVGLDPDTADLGAPGRAVTAALRRLGVPICELQPALMASEKATYFKFDGHWTPAGHAVVAQTLADCLQAKE